METWDEDEIDRDREKGQEGDAEARAEETRVAKAEDGDCAAVTHPDNHFSSYMVILRPLSDRKAILFQCETIQCSTIFSGYRLLANTGLSAEKPFRFTNA
jgi:hypothetical protein